MKLIDCLSENQPLIALLTRASWTENKVLLRFGNSLEIVTAWNTKEKFTPTVNDFFADDWSISSSYDKWLRTKKGTHDENIEKRSDKPVSYGVNIVSKCEYVGSVEAHSVKEAYQITYDMWCNDFIMHNEATSFNIHENVMQEITVFDDDGSQYTFNCEEEDEKAAK